MSANARFYVTTPIYYVSDVPHLGHAYTTVVCDTLARYHRLRGDDTYFLTGTDEHGQKIARMAEQHGVGEKEYADRIAAAYQAAWRALGISHDHFIRTTDVEHERTVQELWSELERRGDIYKGNYEGWYCVPCEQFYTEKELGDGNRCPIHKLPVERVQEESYYFRLSKYGPQLLEHYEKHPEFIQPEARRNEVRAFVAGGLEDLSISRTTFSWGVAVPGAPKHVVYVWLDALINYYSGTRLSDATKPFWDDSATKIVHVIGKEISRFHAVYWPAFLLAAGLRLPTTVFVHGWWTVDGHKMSKTAGNVVDPVALSRDLGVDAFRYFVLREIPLGADGDFSHTSFIGRYNAELANDLGNLLNRTLGMADKYFSGTIPEADVDRIEANQEVVREVEQHLEAYQLSQGLSAIWRIVRQLNTYIDAEGPWKRDAAERARILTTVLEWLRVTSHLIEPFLPETAAGLRAQLGVREKPAWPNARPRAQFTVGKGVPLFPRVDDDRKALLLEKWMPKATVASGQAASAPAAATVSVTDSLVSFDDFSKMELRVGVVQIAEPIAKAKKLLRLEVDLGALGTRQIVAGLAERYAPADLVGKQVIVLCNLAPAMLRGVRSEGMVLAAGEDAIVGLGSVVPLSGEVAAGTRIR